MPRGTIQGMLAEVEKTSGALKRYEEIAFAAEQLIIYEELDNRTGSVRAAVDGTSADYRVAVKARREGPEKAAGELYRRIKLQLEAHYNDPAAPQLLEFLHTSPNIPDTAPEWLEALEKMGRGLTAHHEELAFAAERLPQVETAVADLRGAVDEVEAKLALKKSALAEWKAAKADYKSARATLRRKLQAHFGARRDPRLKEFFD